MNHINVADMQISSIPVSGIYILKSHSIKPTKTGKKYLNVTISDSSGEISGNLFGIEENPYSELEDGNIVNVSFVVGEYNGQKQITLQVISAIKDINAVDISDIVATSPEKPETLFDEMYATASSFTNDELRKVCVKALQDNKANLLKYPGAKSVHHAGIGELAYHMCGMLRLAKQIAALYYDRINTELLFAGVILHDIKKIDEFETSKLGLVSDYSKRGKLLGHITMGMEYIGDICRELEISEETTTVLQHMILSHHGKPEYGSPVYPMFIEAYLLNQIDLIDSRVYMFNQTTKYMEDHTFSDKQYALDNVQVYKHNLNTSNVTTAEMPLFTDFNDENSLF